ncbi:hypothetical protein PUN28_019740 [Cardiocondyla obscurior]|uniref:Uncharacterized protein n=1 Tax=Cardiocondyla obscurior TaxID=286306 RepID=A0AAW2ECI7_9HYME
MYLRFPCRSHKSKKQIHGCGIKCLTKNLALNTSTNISNCALEAPTSSRQTSAGLSDRTSTGGNRGAVRLDPFKHREY